MVQYIVSLIKTLEKFGMPQKPINLIECSIGHIDIKVKVGHTLSETVQGTTGLRQKDAVTYSIQHSLGKSSKRSNSK